MNKVPTDFRRVTMLVNDMAPIVEIYHEILGLEIYYDQELVVSGKGVTAAPPGSKARLVILKCNDPYIGMLGAMQYLDPPLPESDSGEPRNLRAGDCVFVMNHDNVESAYERLLDVEGVKIVAEPHVSEYPRAGGESIRVVGLSFFDPSGFFVELNQVIE